MDNQIKYEKPAIVDYGTVEQLTAGCIGSPRDFHGKNNALTEVTSRGFCFSTP
ncbi:MAG TPA: lasso RiPP family leader peptide-containing protein [Solirubrobacterales bacterium]|nr:lasso RiPP family leader peptide-containing protein [Solirubrobacterales bacterium]